MKDKNKNFIRDNGKFRNCAINIAKASPFELINEMPDIYGFKAVWGEYIRTLKEAMDSLVFLFLFLIGTILFPISPLIRAYFSIKRAKKELQNNKINNESKNNKQ